MNLILKIVSSAAMVALVSGVAQARYVVADYAGKGINLSKPSHIIVAARGTDMGLQFHMTAAAHARKLMDANPNDQVVLISVMEAGMSAEEAAQYSQPGVNAEGEDYNRLLVHRTLKRRGFTKIEQQLQYWGFGQFQNYDQKFNNDAFVGQLSRFPRIASLNVYGHSTTFYGLIMDGPFNRVDPSENMTGLKNNFMPGAYAWFHGCNTGQKIVRELSNQWGIPITGAYTGTGFQELFFDNTPEGVNFYHDYDGGPPLTEKDGKMVARRMGSNRKSFKKSYTCDKVPCVRMMPDNGPYNGHWGSFSEGGLGFYRFSCSTKSSPPISKDVCYSTMAKAMLNQVNNVYTDGTTDLATFKLAVQDHLCPRGNKKVPAGYSYEACAAALEASLTNPNVVVDVYKGKSLSCLMDGNCQFKFRCEKSGLLDLINIDLLAASSCSITNFKNPSAPNRTLVDEYAKYVKGFEILQRMRR